MVDRNQDARNTMRPTTGAGGSLSGAGEATTSARSTTPTGSGQSGSTGQGMAEGVQQGATQVKEQVQEKAVELKEQVAAGATSRLETGKEAASGGLNTVARAIRQTGDQLREQDQEGVARYIDGAAKQLEGFAGYLQGRDVRELVRDVEGFARREPALFLGGTFALGMLAARFLKSSAPATQGGQGGQRTWQGQADWYGAAPALPAPSSYRPPVMPPMPSPMSGVGASATGGTMGGALHGDRTMASGTTGAATSTGMAGTAGSRPATGGSLGTTPGRGVSETDVIVGGPPIDENIIVGGPPIDRGRETR